MPLGSPVEVTYEFKVADDAPAFTEDLVVFVHFVDADGELMWTDDHHPPVPTTQWKPGQTIQYNRLLFAPVYPYVGDASVKVGLYGKDQKRLPLVGADDGQRAYTRGDVPGGAAERERLPELQGRLAPGGGPAGQLRQGVALDAEGGDALVQEPEAQLDASSSTMAVSRR